MKNILVPTTLESDTLNAVKLAIQQTKGKKCTIILLLINEIPDTDASTAFLRNMKSVHSFSQKKVLENCWKLVEAETDCILKIHHQYGISAPMMKNLMKFLSVDFTILIPSYKNADKKIHKQFTQILSNCKCPILHSCSTFEQQDFTAAMYLEQAKSKLHVEDLHELIPEDFNLKIVSQAKLFQDQNPEDLQSLLHEAILKNKINLLIETRKPKKIILKKMPKTSAENFGLPVLSLYEELVWGFK